MITETTVTATSLQKIPGFEKTDYAYFHGSIVWTGKQASTDHPRNFFSTWQPQKFSFNAEKLRDGAFICKSFLESNQQLATRNKGLLLWLQHKEMPFPLNLSVRRFDAIKLALIDNDLEAFTTASLCVLGLGNGLTPSGDDFVGGIMFTLAHMPRPLWKNDLQATVTRIHQAAKESTNVISAALLDDMMSGKSYSALHDVLHALHAKDIVKIEAASTKLLSIGASSGADMLAGVLLALTTQNTKSTHSVH